MNKTVNINLGGMFFHIDEDAYQKLTRYFDAIKRSLSNSNGQDEIIKDIEMRIGEIITEKHTSDKQVINVKEVDEIITIMGQPEDYRIEGDDNPEPAMSFESGKRRRKLYRDTEKGMLGGVCTGLGHYFGIDMVWIRILFVVFACISFGTWIFVYIVLWAVTPAAVTTSEKLEMTGEPVNISNIERKVREEFDTVSNKFKNADFDKMGRQAKTGADRVASNIGDVFVTIFKVFAKILGAVIVVFSSLALLGVVITSVVMIFTSSLPDNTILNNFNTPIGLETPLWAQGILFLLAFGIPLFFLFMLGLNLLVTNLRSIGRIAKYTLLAVWLVVVGIVISLALNEASQLAYEGKSVQKETLNINTNDTLRVKFRTNDYYAKDLHDRTDLRLTQDENNNDVIYSNNVSIQVMRTDEKLPYLQIEKLAKGKTAAEAKSRSEKIKYAVKIEGNTLILDNYLISMAADKMRGQSVELFLYLPEGIYFKPDESLRDYDWSEDGDFFNLHHSGNYLYKTGKNKVKCLDCPAEENDYGDVEGAPDPSEADSTSTTTTTTTLTVGHPGHPQIKIETNGKVETKDIKSLELNSDGTVIKTN
jgi:phage shock protein PspC (stress-responsive transcriptional regulator)